MLSRLILVFCVGDYIIKYKTQYILKNPIIVHYIRPQEDVKCEMWNVKFKIQNNINSIMLNLETLNRLMFQGFIAYESYCGENNMVPIG